MTVGSAGSRGPLPALVAPDSFKGTFSASEVATAIAGGLRAEGREAVETTAGDMPARWVIHAATMELGGPTSSAIIERATRSTLAKAEELGARSLALVAFGTGVGGFPIDEAARIMVSAAREHSGGLERIVFAVHGDDAERAFREAIEA